MPPAKKHAPSKPTNRKRKLSLQVENAPPAKAVSTDREQPHTCRLQGEIEFVRQGCISPYRFNPVDEQWQINACTALGLGFLRSNRVRPGGPDLSLKPPDGRTIRRIIGDGNCLFRCFSYIITGSEDQHMSLRIIITSYMISIAHLLLDNHISSMYSSVQQYITDTKMDQEGTWGTHVGMFTLAHLLKTIVFSYITEDQNWWRYSPHFIDRSLVDDCTTMAMYIRHLPDHFDVVRSVLK